MVPGPSLATPMMSYTFAEANGNTGVLVTDLTLKKQWMKY